MTAGDVTLLAKKILLGIVITLIPFAIIFTGLYLMQKLLSKDNSAAPRTLNK